MIFLEYKQIELEITTIAIVKLQKTSKNRYLLNLCKKEVGILSRLALLLTN